MKRHGFLYVLYSICTVCCIYNTLLMASASSRDTFLMCIPRVMPCSHPHYAHGRWSLDEPSTTNSSVTCTWTDSSNKEFYTTFRILDPILPGIAPLDCSTYTMSDRHVASSTHVIACNFPYDLCKETWEYIATQATELSPDGSWIYESAQELCAIADDVRASSEYLYLIDNTQQPIRVTPTRAHRFICKHIAAFVELCLSLDETSWLRTLYTKNTATCSTSLQTECCATPSLAAALLASYASPYLLKKCRRLSPEHKQRLSTLIMTTPGLYAELAYMKGPVCRESYVPYSTVIPLWLFMLPILVELPDHRNRHIHTSIHTQRAATELLAPFTPVSNMLYKTSSIYESFHRWKTFFTCYYPHLQQVIAHLGLCVECSCPGKEQTRTVCHIHFDE